MQQLLGCLGGLFGWVSVGVNVECEIIYIIAGLLKCNMETTGDGGRFQRRV